MVDEDIIQSLTYDEKVECIVNALATPIWRRRIGDEMLNKLISDVYFEIKERKEKEKYERI